MMNIVESQGHDVTIVTCGAEVHYLLMVSENEPTCKFFFWRHVSLRATENSYCELCVF